MARRRASPLKLRAQRVLGFDSLEDRVQPNDMFGLGLSLLTGTSPTSLAPAERPSALVAEQPSPGGPVVAETAPAAPMALPPVPPGDVVTAPFRTDAFEDVFETINTGGVGATEFALHSPTRTNPLPHRDSAQAPPAAVIGGSPLRGNGARPLAMPVVPAVIQSEQLRGGSLLTLLAGVRKEEQAAGRGPGYLSLSDDGTSATMDSFGYGIEFLADGPNQLFETGYFYSTGGSPLLISSDFCTVVPGYQIQSDYPGHAFSMVQCGETYFYFDHTIYGSAQMWLTVGVAFGPLSCVYAYNDYDVVDFENDSGSRQAGPGYEQFVVREGAKTPKYLFTDYFSDPAPVHWEQAEYPGLYKQIESFAGCGDLSDGPTLFGPGDWTGGFQYNYQPGAEYYLWINAHLRSDETPFP